MKYLLSIFTSALLLFHSSTLPLLVHSEDSDFAGVVSQDPQYAPLNDVRPSNLVSGTINLILGGAGVVAFLYLLYGGIQWIMAGGDKEGVEKARKKITAALIGVSIVFSSYAFIFVVQALFGIDILRVDIQYIENTNYSSSGGGGGGGGGPTPPAPTSPPGTTDCGGGLNLGQCGLLNGTWYRCVPYGQLCNFFPAPPNDFPQNCPDPSCP